MLRLFFHISDTIFSITRPWGLRRKFFQNLSKDPKKLGWFEWVSTGTNSIKISLRSDETMNFYGFDLEWKCATKNDKKLQQIKSQMFPGLRSMKTGCYGVSGTSGKISNARVRCKKGQCYKPDQHECWKIRPKCLTTKGQALRYFVAEILSKSSSRSSQEPMFKLP